MVILYDDSGFRQHVGGVSRYYTELIKNLPGSIEHRLGVVRTQNLYLQGAPFFIPIQRLPRDLKWFCDKVLCGGYFRGLARIYKFFMNLFPDFFKNDNRINELLFMQLARRDDVDVIHLTAAHQFDFNWRKAVARKPFVVTVHDLIPELIQGQEYVISGRRRVLRAATHVIAVSEFTKNRIMELYGVPREKISVVYHGFSKVSKERFKNLAPLVKGDYVLYVGGRHTYKNFPFFVMAMRRVMIERSDLRVVCTGGPFTEEERKMLEVLGLRSRFIYKFATDEELLMLYKHARCFVYPSKMEGFGIPILEAFAANCPVLLSNCSCFPEIAKTAALYFKDEDENDFSCQLRKILVDENLRRDLCSAGCVRLKDFSWKRCAHETAEVYARAKTEFSRR